MADASSPNPNSDQLELAKLDLDRARYRADITKWIVVAVGAVISFAVIDYGKLQLEKFRIMAENQRELLRSYLTATEAPEPDIWKRKLHLIINSSSEEQTKLWARRELEYIDRFAGLDALYRETLKIASQLVEPNQLKDPERARARARFNQLYWADLPFADESQAVIKAMIAFRTSLIQAENSPEATDKWEQLNVNLIGLSKALAESKPKSDL